MTPIDPKAKEEFTKNVAVSGIPPATVEYAKLGLQFGEFLLKQAGGRQAVKSIRDLYISQADMFMKTADYIRGLAQKDVDVYREAAEEQVSGMRATYAYGGVRVGTGSTLSTVIAARRRHKFNELYIQHSRFTQARAYEDRATLSLMEGNQQAYQYEMKMYEQALGSAMELATNDKVFNMLGKSLGGDDPMGLLSIFSGLDGVGEVPWQDKFNPLLGTPLKAFTPANLKGGLEYPMPNVPTKSPSSFSEYFPGG